jgi:hypothetical protein
MSKHFEKMTLYKSNVIWDKAQTLGFPFVMFYNGKIKNATRGSAWPYPKI